MAERFPHGIMGIVIIVIKDKNSSSTDVLHVMYGTFVALGISELPNAEYSPN